MSKEGYMNWKVFYRNDKGIKTSDVFRAENRHELFTKLSELKINPIKVERVENSEYSTVSKFTFKKVILGIAAVVSAAICGYLFLRTENSSCVDTAGKDKVIKKDSPKSLKPTFPKGMTKAKTIVSPNVDNLTTTEVQKVKSEFSDGRELMSRETNGMYIVEMYRMPDGKTLQKMRYAVKSIWKSNTDQLLHMALSTPPGVEMPPIPYTAGDMTKEFKESLKTPIVINEDDSEEVHAAKERIIEARETVKKLLDEGYSFADIIADHEAQNKQDAQMRNEVFERIEELKREGDIEAAKEYMQKANRVLQNFGITEVQDRTLKE